MSETGALAVDAQQQFLLVSLGHLQLGLPVASLVKTVRLVAVTALPGAPSVVEGVINYHGRLVAVLDIRARFNLAPEPLSVTQYLVLVKLAQRLVAIRVDRVLDLITIDAARIEPATDIHRASHFIAGIARLDDGLMVIHELGRFLNDLEAAQLDQALLEPPSQ
ncbi:chemotaxis protein CheW [Marinobacterium rhizophilum]|uniref:Purine-binding chemotaxis protein CheW n=1 Tax=Marinobacterium rhizophilum TaxID=420402 RepID=A0ABY5HFM6_9GAMM|nr:chemotaxis protein CheW [Marinobacterium rhizophilum]UTW10070.1 purine-binding chemotaxis protein CheW [Marinobacterium rhizophilum]